MRDRARCRVLQGYAAHSEGATVYIASMCFRGRQFLGWKKQVDCRCPRRDNIPTMAQLSALTSQDSQLRIATLTLSSGGTLGMTICPGKQAPTSLGGHAWRRDLSIDLDTIRSWGASAVVTLMESWELRQYGVSGLGSSVRDLGMYWYHLPIVDGAAPDAGWDDLWSKTYRDELHRLLDAGGAALIHCLGGRGRTGTLAAKLLIEYGMDPETAIQTVRAVREGAIETIEQEAYLRSLFQ